MGFNHHRVHPDLTDVFAIAAGLDPLPGLEVPAEDLVTDLRVPRCGEKIRSGIPVHKPFRLFLYAGIMGDKDIDISRWGKGKNRVARISRDGARGLNPFALTQFPCEGEDGFGGRGVSKDPGIEKCPRNGIQPCLKMGIWVEVLNEAGFRSFK